MIREACQMLSFKCEAPNTGKNGNVCLTIQVRQNCDALEMGLTIKEVGKKMMAHQMFILLCPSCPIAKVAKG